MRLRRLGPPVARREGAWCNRRMLFWLWCLFADPAVLPPSAEALLAESRYDEAVVAAQKEIARGGLDRTGLAVRYLLLGRAHAAGEERELATAAFGKALSIEPTAALPPGSAPKIVEVFALAARLHAGRGGVRLDVGAGRAQPGALPPLRVRAVDDPYQLVARIKLVSRAPRRAWRVDEMALPAAGTEIDLEPLREQGRAERAGISYFIEGLDGAGNRVAAVASQDHPLFLLPAPAAPIAPAAPAMEAASLWSRAWFWAVVGGALVLGTSAVFLATRPGDPTAVSPEVLVGRR